MVRPYHTMNTPRKFENSEERFNAGAATEDEPSEAGAAAALAEEIDPAEEYDDMLCDSDGTYREPARKSDPVHYNASSRGVRSEDQGGKDLARELALPAKPVPENARAQHGLPSGGAWFWTQNPALARAAVRWYRCGVG